MRRGVAVVSFVAVLAAAPVRAAEPTPAECARASEQAFTMRQQGKLRDARAALATCTAASCPAEIRAECEKRLVDVNAAMPSIVFDVKDANGKDVADLRIAMDGAPIEARTGAVLTADPGSHAFRFEAPGMGALEQTFVLRETEKNRREAIVMKPAAVAVPTPAPTSTPAATATSTPAGVQPRGSSSQKTWGVVLGATGIVGLGVGTWFGLGASSKWSSSQDECASPTQCPQHAQAVTDRDDAQGAATISTITFAAGGVALAAGAVLWLTAPKETGVAIAPGLGGMHVVGTF